MDIGTGIAIGMSVGSFVLGVVKVVDTLWGRKECLGHVGLVRTMEKVFSDIATIKDRLIRIVIFINDNTLKGETLEDETMDALMGRRK